MTTRAVRPTIATEPRESGIRSAWRYPNATADHAGSAPTTCCTQDVSSACPSPRLTTRAQSRSTHLRPVTVSLSDPTRKTSQTREQLTWCRIHARGFARWIEEPERSFERAEARQSAITHLGEVDQTRHWELIEARLVASARRIHRAQQFLHAANGLKVSIAPRTSNQAGPPNAPLVYEVLPANRAQTCQEEYLVLAVQQRNRGREWKTRCGQPRRNTWRYVGRAPVIFITQQQQGSYVALASGPFAGARNLSLQVHFRPPSSRSPGDRSEIEVLPQPCD